MLYMRAVRGMTVDHHLIGKEEKEAQERGQAIMNEHQERVRTQELWMIAVEQVLNQRVITNLSRNVQEKFAPQQVMVQVVKNTELSMSIGQRLGTDRNVKTRTGSKTVLKDILLREAEEGQGEEERRTIMEPEDHLLLQVTSKREGVKIVNVEIVNVEGRLDPTEERGRHLLMNWVTRKAVREVEGGR